MADLVKVTIDGREALVPKGSLIVEAAKQVGIEIPVFCYHEKMHPVGACRMCLVEIEKVPRPQAACTTPVTDGMVVKTDTPAVLKARKGVVEFLLTNHPLDCPVCDKGGECPLQDTTFKHGCDKSRFIEEKRHYVKPVRLSPLIVLDRERCILCSRCVRFQREVAGDETLTFLNRGAKSEVGVLPGRVFDSPFSGNTIELCPVGALTSAKFRFRARSWELKKTPSVCSMCGVGCNVSVETRSGTILRLTSRENPTVDDGWLCDLGRFTYQFANDPRRLRVPLVRKNGELVPATWEEALDAVAQGLKAATEPVGGAGVAGLISPRSTNEELYLFQKLFRTVLKSNSVDHGPHGEYDAPETGVDGCSRALEDLDSAQIIIVAGADLLAEQPVLDLRIKKAVWKKGARLIGILSKQTDLTKLSRPWLHANKGTEAAVLNGILHILLSEGLIGDAARERLGSLHGIVARSVAQFTPEMVLQISGVAAEALREVAQLVAGTSKVAILFPRPAPGAPEGLREACGRLAMVTGGLREPGGGLFPLGTEANSQGAMDLGILPNLLPGQRPLTAANLDHLQQSWGVRPPAAAGLNGLGMMEAAAAGQLHGLYIVGLDPAGDTDSEQLSQLLSRVGFLVVQDLFMTLTAQRAHVVLPAAGFAEKEGTVTSLERRVQRLQVAVPTPGQIKPDWETIWDVAKALGAGWRYAGAAEVFDEIAEAVPLYGGLKFAELGLQGRRWQYTGAQEGAESSNGRARRLWYTPLRVENSGT